MYTYIPIYISIYIHIHIIYIYTYPYTRYTSIHIQMFNYQYDPVCYIILPICVDFWSCLSSSEKCPPATCGEAHAVQVETGSQKVLGLEQKWWRA